MGRRVEKYLLVQPHSDDILFSCFHCLLENEVQILTIENDPVRVAEDRKLFDFLDIPYHVLDIDFKDDSYYGFFKKYKEVTIEDATNYLFQHYDKNTMMQIGFEICDWVKSFMYKNSGYRVMSPLGIGHPFHLWVREQLEAASGLMHYYREFPHSYKRRNQAQMEEAKKVYSFLHDYPVEKIHDVKWELAKKFYKSQSSLLFYEQGYVNKQLPEEIYSGDDLPF